MKATILQKAAELFVRRGYNGVSMREIAAAAGVSKAGIYYHFKNKEELLTEVFSRYLREIGSILEECGSGRCSVQERISRFTAHLLGQPPEKRAILRLATQEISALKPEIRENFHKQYHAQFVGRIESILKEGVDNGELKAVDPSLAVWILLGMMYPFFYPGAETVPIDPEKTAEQLLMVFFHGLLASG